MEQRTPYQQLRQIQTMIDSFRPGSGEGVEVGRAAHKAYDALYRQAQLVQHMLRDYELSEDDIRAQARILPQAIKGLEQLRGHILKASEFDLIGAVDVAQLSAQLDGLVERLR